MTPEPTRRVNHARGHRYLLDGVQVDGVTTVIREGVAKPKLPGWAGRTAAAYAVDHWDELATVGVSERLERIKGAPWAARDAAAGRGTEIHALAQRLARGEEVTVPEALVGHVDAYLGFVERWRPVDLLVEAVVGSRKHRYMGTLDLIADLADGDRWLVDFKTSGSGVYPEAALQLSAYRHAEFYLGQDGAEEPLPEVDRCGVVWLRADGFDLIPVDAGWATFRLFQYAQQMANFTRADRARYIGDAMLSPAEEVAS